MGEVFVSMILAVRNEASFIARTLDAVLHQEYPAEAMEIIVADGASDDGTVAVIQSLDTTGRVCIIPNPHRIQAAGLNLAIQQSCGDIIVRVDGHTIIAPNYVRECVALLHQTGAWNVGGRMDPIGLTPMGRAIAAAGETPFAVPSAFHVSRSARYADTVYLGAWPRTALFALGGFDEYLRTNEDYDLNYRIRRAGGRLYLSPTIRSSYVCRQNLPALARQYLGYGIGKADMLRKYPASLRLRQLVAPAFVVALVCGLAGWQISPPVHGFLLAVALGYCLLSIMFSAYAAWRIAGDLRLLWRLPLVYLTIHVCWGTGFWLGLLHSGGTVRNARTHMSIRRRAAVRPVISDALGIEERHGL